MCRIGGEEFAVILPDTPAEAALQLAQTISDEVDALAIPHAGSTVASWVTTSVGVATRTADHPLRTDELMAQADAALYRRKRQEGRHGVSQALPPDQGAETGPA